MTRRAELDALRGLLLVLMTLTHLPVRLSVYSSQIFGFVSAAEGFVFLSGFFAGLIYWRGLELNGEGWMRAKLHARAKELYGWHLLLLLFVFTAGAAIGHYGERPLLRNLLSFYFEHPVVAVLGAPLLLYQPPLLDILPTYIVMLLLTPLWLTQARRYGWNKVLLCSALVWVFAQYGGRGLLLDGFNALTGDLVPKLPLPMLGYFDDFAWQLLWVAGLWCGAQAVCGHLTPPRLSLRVAAVVAAVAYWTWHRGLLEIALQGVGVPLLSPGDLPLFDKVMLRPLRLLNFAVLAVSAAWVLPCLGAASRRSVGALLALLGRASLKVFVLQLFLVLLAYGLVDRDESPLDTLTQAVVLVGTFGALLAVAYRYGGGRLERAVALNPHRPDAPG